MAQRNANEIKEHVRQRYGDKARERLQAAEAGPSADGDESCCGPAEPQPLDTSMLDRLYSRDEVEGLPEETLMSLGCGNPTAIAQMQPGERVLDLGSGGGLDCFLAARKVGREGMAVGLDMTSDMVELARQNAQKAGITNVEFHLGEMESMPFENDSFDVIISNCVINLSPDKDAVLQEAHRVLKPGGRFRVSDLVWLREPSAKERADMEKWAGCIAGALLADDFQRRLTAAGFAEASVKVGGQYGQEGVASAYIEARKPSSVTADDAGCC